MEEGVAVGHPVLLVVHGTPDSLLVCGIPRIHGQTLPLLRLHQPVDLSVVGGADAAKSSASGFAESLHGNTCRFFCSSIPGVEGAEQEDNQSHDALSVPPLRFPWGLSGSGSRWWSGTRMLDQTQQTGVTPLI